MTATHIPGGRQRVTWPRLARISLALASMSAVWFVVNLIHPVGPA
jgi:hypothetical protein